MRERPLPRATTSEGEQEGEVRTTLPELDRTLYTIFSQTRGDRLGLVLEQRIMSRQLTGDTRQLSIINKNWRKGSAP